jgi:hypothetical protein
VSVELPAARVARIERSFSRSRFVFAALAFVVPAAFFALFERQARRLEALADRGREGIATVTGVKDHGDHRSVAYAYEVDGVRYTWSVAESEAPTAAPGSSFPIVYLPEDPALNRPGSDGAAARAEAIGNRVSTKKLLAGAFGFFAWLGVFSEARLRQVRRFGEAELTSPLAARARGRLALGLVVVPAVLVMTTLHAVDAQAHGEPVWPAIVGGALVLGLAGVVVRAAVEDQTATGGARTARWMQIAAYAASGAAVLRLLVWLAR